MKILICNAGSTSLKFKLWVMPEHTVLAEGRIERVGTDIARFRYISDRRTETIDPVSIPDYASGIRKFLDFLTNPETGAISDLKEVEYVGFKTVLAKGYPGVHELTEEVKQGMRDYLSVAPAHNSCYLEAIQAFETVLPTARRFGVFETAFHQTIPLAHRLYPVPYEWYEQYGLMKMGYHGASHGYIAKRMQGKKRVISCHLGGSGSICAILDGKSIDNSFGFSLQAGVPHASRTGDVDVYVIPFLLDQGLTMEEIFYGLGKNGGMKGLSGTSGDMRDVLEAAAAGSERAQIAFDVMATAVKRYVGAYAMELGGLDAIVFTGGIGENCAPLRKAVLDSLAFMGLKYDEALNEGSGERKLSTEDSAVEAYVVCTDEERMVVDSVYDAVTC